MASISEVFQPAVPGISAVRNRWSVVQTAWSKRRQIIRELNAHSDRELADMGLTRADIPAVARGTFCR